MNNRQWFLNRIGKTVYRTKVSCQCPTCKAGYEIGVLICDEMHADYLSDIQGELNVEYFDTIEERDKYETQS